MKKLIIVGIIGVILIPSSLITGIYLNKTHNNIKSKDTIPSIEGTVESLKSDNDEKKIKDNEKSNPVKDEPTQKKEKPPVEKTPTQNIVRFNKKTLSTSGFKLVTTQKFDFNNDGIKDKLLEYTNPNSGYNEFGNERTNLVVLKDGKTEEVLTSFETDMMTMKIISVSDFTGDGVYDLLFSTHTGGQRGGGNNLMHFSNGEYITTPFQEGGMYDFKFANGFKVVANHSIKGKREFTTKNQNAIDEYIQFKVFDLNGNLTNSEPEDYYALERKGANGKFLDYDNDGRFEFVAESGIGSYGLYGGHRATTLIEMFEFKDGKLYLADFKLT